MRPSVLFFAEAGPEQPCSFYRCFLPVRALQLRRWAAFVSGEGVICPDGRFASPSLDGPTDVVVIRRPIAADGLTTFDISEDVAVARAAGQRVYVDLDDDLWNLPPTNPASKIMTAESNAAFERVINASDGALVSTPGLAVSLARHVEVPVHVCPNGIDPALYIRSGEHDPLAIGWLGPVKWRWDDLKSVADWLVPFLNDRAGRVSFWHMGTMPGDPTTAAQILEGLKIPVGTIPWVPFQCLGQSLAKIDVLIVPQRRGGAYEAFANARSPTSALAGIASGAVVWATPIDSYCRLFGDSLPPDLATIVDSRDQRREYRRRQRKILATVNLQSTAVHYEKVFL